MSDAGSAAQVTATFTFPAEGNLRGNNKGANSWVSDLPEQWKTTEALRLSFGDARFSVEAPGRSETISSAAVVSPVPWATWASRAAQHLRMALQIREKLQALIAQPSLSRRR